MTRDAVLRVVVDEHASGRGGCRWRGRGRSSDGSVRDWNETSHASRTSSSGTSTPSASRARRGSGRRCRTMRHGHGDREQQQREDDDVRLVRRARQEGHGGEQRGQPRRPPIAWLRLPARAAARPGERRAGAGASGTRGQQERPRRRTGGARQCERPAQGQQRAGRGGGQRRAALPARVAARSSRAAPSAASGVTTPNPASHQIASSVSPWGVSRSSEAERGDGAAQRHRSGERRGGREVGAGERAGRRRGRARAGRADARLDVRPRSGFVAPIPALNLVPIGKPKSLLL